MSPTGPYYAGTAASASGSYGVWTNPSNATGPPDATYTSGDLATYGGTNNLNLTNFGFIIPSTAVIDGIYVEFDRYGTNATTAAIQLLKASTLSGTAKTGTDVWPSGEAFTGYGGATDLWGASLSPSDINNSGFGVAISANATHDPGDAKAYIDAVRITVYWHTPPTNVFKEYYYKSFNPGGQFLGNLPIPSSDLSFSQDINNAGSQTTITIPKSADVSAEAVDDLTDESGNLLTDENSNQLTDEGQLPIYLPSSFTEDALIKNGNLIQIWVVNYWHPQGKCIFLGIMENCAATFGGDANDDSITIIAYGDGQDLDNYMLRGYPYTYTSDVAQGASNVFVTIYQAGLTDKGGFFSSQGQTWKVGAGVTNLGAINIALYGSANVTLSVYDSPALTTLLGSATQFVNAPTETTVQFALANEITTIPGQTYFFAVTVDPGQSIQIATQNTAVYANGSMYNATTSGGGGSTGYLPVTGDLYFETFSGTGSTTATFSLTDPTTGMLEPFMNDYIARGGVISYNSSTVQATGLSLTAEFNSNTIKEGVDEVLTLAPSGYYYYIDQGTDLLYFLPASATADVVLTKGLHMNTIKIAESIEYLINTIFFTGGADSGNPGYNIYTTDSDAASIAKYRPRLDRPTDSNVIDAGTAHTASQEEIATHKKPQNSSVVTVLDKVMDIYSLHVGQVVGFNGFGNFADSLLAQIVRIEWQAEQATLTLGVLPKRIATTVEQSVKQLVALQTVSSDTNPVSPS